MAPKLKADHQLCAFRREAQLRWVDFNFLWAEICHYIAAPAFNVLLDIHMAGQPEFNKKLSEMTSDLLTCGVTWYSWNMEVRARR